MTRALHSAMGLPSSSTSAPRMLALVMPAEVRRSLMVPAREGNGLAGASETSRRSRRVFIWAPRTAAAAPERDGTRIGSLHHCAPCSAVRPRDAAKFVRDFDRMESSAEVAQLVEQWSEEPCVAGSSPALGTAALHAVFQGYTPEWVTPRCRHAGQFTACCRYEPPPNTT